MAGNWIKIETSTPDKPEIYQLAEILGIDPDAVVGKLIRFWAWADQQSVSGDDLPVSATIIDRLTHQPGFSAALRKVDWLQARSDSLVIPHFSRHNGQSAKARAETNRRVAAYRAREKTKTAPPTPPPVTNVTQTPLPNALPKPLPEKRREEKNKNESVAHKHTQEILGKIAALNPAWRAPVLEAKERAPFADNLAYLTSIPPQDWPTIAAYLATKHPQGSPYWKPRNRLQFLDNVGQVHSYAIEWHRKQPKKKPKKKPTHDADHPDTATPEDIAAFIASSFKELR